MLILIFFLPPSSDFTKKEKGTGKNTMESLDIYKCIDPFSGKPYKYSRERKVLYSFGRDCKDNDGAVSFSTAEPSDIVVPCRIHHKN